MKLEKDSGNRIEIVVQEDNTVSVRDYGRGVPMDWNESEGNSTGS